MAITQLSVFLENKPGQLAAAVKLISEGGVNIRALSLADTRDFGILRLIVSDNKKAKELLADPTLRIHEIAEETGFSDVAHFSRSFKKIAGCTPGEYRNRQA